MKKKIILSVTILLLAFTNAYAQLIYPPISVGDLLDEPNYTYTSSTAEHPHGHIHHVIILPVPMNVSISHCGSTLSASDLSLLDIRFNVIAQGSSAAQDGCSNGNLKYLRVNNLAAGTYFVKSEFTNLNAQIKVSITSSASGIPVGNTRSDAINVGTKSSAFGYTDAKNTNAYTNEYNGQNTKDVFYKFTLSTPMDVVISHCSALDLDTYVHLLDANGARIGYNNDYSGPGACGNPLHAYLKMDNLAAGTYYVVSEGYNSNGRITTTIRGSIPKLEGNYILTSTPTVSTTRISSAPADKIQHTYQYFDGLGRPVQTVQKQVTPDKYDLVTYQEYDAFGRESNSWLPAKVATNTGAFVPLATVRTRSSSTYADARAYSKVDYEASPLNRVVSQTGPGADWHNNGKKVTTEYLANNATYVCRWYRASDTRTNSQVSIASGAVNYPAGELYVSKLTDEDSNISYEFKDKLGQVVLTRQMEGSVAHDTYYVYDSYGNLRAVLPPLAADAMTSAGSWAENHATIMNYAYLYKYDDLNRCIAKKLPGTDWVYYVYDYAGRLIFTQDGEMRVKTPKQWLFSIPDVFGRVVLTGTCTNDMDYAANPLGNNVIKASRNNANGTYKGYATPTGVAISSPVVMSVNYYDDYNFMNANSIPDSTNLNVKYEPLSGYGTRYLGGYKGLLTGTMSAQLNQGGVTTSFLYSVMYYDDRGRVIQTKSNNHLAGGVDKEYIGYNFTGQPLKRRLVHSATGKTTQTQLYEYLYDHAGRLTQVKHGLNTSTAGTVIALNTHDDLGRLKTQKKGSLPVTTYGYNVRSWMKSIANNSLFNETLYYNESYGGSAKKYGGNVSAMSWKVGSETLRGYAFAYDGLSRLKSASYLLSGAANSNNTVSGITYDKHGNMKTIQRRGKITASAYGVIDNLTMAHSGNQLTNVADAGTTVAIAESNDFKKGSTAAIQYAYNKNGAMSKDLNKSISAISYNLLNLPAQVTIGGVAHKYTYSADGRKLRVEQGTTNRDYVGSMIYENGSLKRVLIDGGYVEGGVYYYYLNDHLGNTRVVASGTGTILQKNDYYPFGMPMAETANSQQEVQPYKFGGKEFERKNGLKLYDFEARQLDPTLGRFTSMDPMAEDYYSISPYAYVMNNPMRFVDPDGRRPGDPEKSVVLPEVTIIGQKVTEPVTGFWPSVSYYLFGGTHTTPVYGVDQYGNMSSKPIGSITYNVDRQGNITGIAPMGGNAPLPSKTALSVASILKKARGLWTLTKQYSSAIKFHKIFGTLYKSKSDGLWWAVDNAKHGGSKFKVFKETKKGLEWIHDADEYGDFIINKHKGPTGTFIPWGELKTIY